MCALLGAHPPAAHAYTPPHAARMCKVSCWSFHTGFFWWGCAHPPASLMLVPMGFPTQCRVYAAFQPLQRAKRQAHYVHNATLPVAPTHATLHPAQRTPHWHQPNAARGLMWSFLVLVVNYVAALLVFFFLRAAYLRDVYFHSGKGVGGLHHCHCWCPALQFWFLIHQGVIM